MKNEEVKKEEKKDDDEGKSDVEAGTQEEEILQAKEEEEEELKDEEEEDGRGGRRRRGRGRYESPALSPTNIKKKHSTKLTNKIKKQGMKFFRCCLHDCVQLIFVDLVSTIGQLYQFGHFLYLILLTFYVLSLSFLGHS